MAGFSSNPPMPSPPPLVSVASSENHPHYLGNLNQHHLPDVCVPVTAAVLNTPNITQGQMNGVAIRQTAVSHQAMILSPATSPARIDPYNIQLLAANTIHDVDTISTKQLICFSTIMYGMSLNLTSTNATRFCTSSTNIRI